MYAKSPDSADLPTLSFFADASSRDDDFMVLGGFAVNGKRIDEIERHIASLRNSYNIGSEFHWKDYKGGGRKGGYESLIKYGYDLIQSGQAHLHIIIAPFHSFSHQTDGRNKTQGRDTSINKIYWQLLVHRVARYYGKSCQIHCRLDAGNDCAEITKMRNQICAESYRRYKTRPNCIRSLIAMDSKSSGIIQMADVICGSIAAERNQRSQSKHKTDLRRFTLQTFKRKDWLDETPKSNRHFTIWNFTG